MNCYKQTKLVLKMTLYLYQIYRCNVKYFYCGHVVGHKQLCRAL